MNRRLLALCCAGAIAATMTCTGTANAGETGATVDTTKLLDTFKNMSLLELSEFVKQFEDQLGTKVDATVTVPVSVTGVAPVPGEQDEFDVVLEAAGDKKIAVIKVVREVVSGLGLKEAKDLVDNAPKPVLDAVNKEVAQKAKEQLEAAGVTVTLG